MVITICAMAAPFLVEARAHHYSKASVFLLYFVAGVARSSYEFANRSIFVDFFPDDKEEAMPCILLLSSITTVAGFIGFQHVAVQVQAVVVLATSVIALLAYRVALGIWLSELAGKEVEEDGAVGSEGRAADCDRTGDKGGEGAYRSSRPKQEKRKKQKKQKKQGQKQQVGAMGKLGAPLLGEEEVEEETNV